MTIEEILKALSELVAGTTDEALKTTLMDSISVGVKTLGYIPETGMQELIDTQVSGLKTKNTALLGSEKKLKDQMAALTVLNDDYGHLTNVLSDFGFPLDNTGKLDDTKLEEFLESKNVGTGEAGKDVVNLERTLRRVEREKLVIERRIEDLTGSITESAKSLSERDSYIESMLIDEALRSSLYKNGFEDLQIGYLLPALKDKSKAVVEIDDITGDRKAITDDGKAVGEWVDWFANTDEGKALKPAPKNHGGGSGGNSGQRGSTTKPFAEMTPTEKGDLFKTDPVKYRQLRDAK